MTISFNGHDLETYFTVGEPGLSIVNSIPDLRDVSGRDGAMFVGSRFGADTISFTLTVIGDVDDRRTAFSTLAGWLDVDEPKALVVPDTPDWFYLAVPSGALEIDRYVGGDSAVITFSIVDAAAYGEQKTLTVPSGGSLTFTVSGTYPTRPLITASAAVRNSTSLTWGLRLDSADFVHLPISTSSSTALEIDCAKRTCKQNSTTGMITLDSDWLELTPGSHTLVMDYGTGAATVKYYERWL